MAKNEVFKSVFSRQPCENKPHEKAKEHVFDTLLTYVCFIAICSQNPQ